MSPRFPVFAVLLLLLIALAWPLPAQQFRALWADAFNIGLKNAAEVTTLVNTARAGNFNAFSYNSSIRRTDLTWSSEAAQTFRVEYSDDLNSWLPHITNLASGGLSTSYLTPPRPG